jgi:hypothetical protein
VSVRDESEETASVAARRKSLLETQRAGAWRFVPARATFAVPRITLLALRAMLPALKIDVTLWCGGRGTIQIRPCTRKVKP